MSPWIESLKLSEVNSKHFLLGIAPWDITIHLIRLYHCILCPNLVKYQIVAPEGYNTRVRLTDNGKTWVKVTFGRKYIYFPICEFFTYKWIFFICQFTIYQVKRSAGSEEEISLPKVAWSRAPGPTGPVSHVWLMISAESSGHRSSDLLYQDRLWPGLRDHRVWVTTIFQSVQVRSLNIWGIFWYQGGERKVCLHLTWKYFPLSRLVTIMLKTIMH